MLILSRKSGEEIVINENIFIRFVECKHGRVRIGIDAPRGISVDRLEVFEKKQIDKLNNQS